MKNITTLVSLMILLFVLSSCANLAKPVSVYVNQKMIESNKHIEKIDKYDSPYTICYKNSDSTYTIYMFSSPISYKDKQGKYEYINNSIVKTKNPSIFKNGYIYQNAKK